MQQLCISDCCCPWLLKDMGWRLILQSVSEQPFLLRGRVGGVQFVTFHDPKLLLGLTVPPQNAQPRTSLTNPLSDPVSQVGPGRYFQGTILPHASGSLYLVLARQVHSPPAQVHAPPRCSLSHPQGQTRQSSMAAQSAGPTSNMPFRYSRHRRGRTN